MGTLYNMVREYKDIKPVTIPKRWATSLAVKAEEGTRWYVERGTSWPTLRHWMREIHEARLGLMIPLQWVPEYVGVSRSAVYQRAKSGGLTVFSFIVMEHKRTILGGVKVQESKTRYDLVPLSECDQWSDLLLERAEEIEAVSGREAEEEEVLEFDKRKLEEFKRKKGGEKRAKARDSGSRPSEGD